MSGISSKIESAKAEITSLQQKIEQSKREKCDVRLTQAVKCIEVPPIRTPPTVKQRRILKGHFGKVTAFHWSSDSRHLVSASHDGNLLVWNAVTHNKLQSIALKSAYVMSVGMEQTKGNLIACGGLDNLCTIYPRNNPERAVEMASHDGFLSCCRFISEAEILTSSGDSTCIHWDIPKGRPISIFAEHSADALWISRKDNNVFCSSSVDLTVKVWDTRTPDHSVLTFAGYHTGDINSVEFMPSDNNCLATCGRDNTVNFFDMRSHSEVASFALNKVDTTNASTGETIPNEGLTSLTFSKSGRVIFCGHANGNVYAFDVLSGDTGPAYAISQAHEKHVSSVAVSPAGDALCTASWDNMLKIWA